MEIDTCGVCGGDGRIGNAFGLTDRCPSCHGTGRRDNDTPLIRDVTKTKASHHRPTNRAVVVEKKQWPETHDGGKLATEVRDCSTVAAEVKSRLIREIIEYEEGHGLCTQTFQKKVRRQIRP
jgi:RecJ-like exonuclease